MSIEEGMNTCTQEESRWWVEFEGNVVRKMFIYANYSNATSSIITSLGKRTASFFLEHGWNTLRIYLMVEKFEVRAIEIESDRDFILHVFGGRLVIVSDAYSAVCSETTSRVCLEAGFGHIGYYL